MNPHPPATTAQARPQTGGLQGSALVMTLFFITLTGIVSGALLSAAVTHRKVADRSYQRERAFHVAEAGLESVCQEIQRRGAAMPSSFLTNGTLDGVDYDCSCISTAALTYRVNCTAEVNNVKWTVSALRVESPSWAKYALWMDQNGTIYFVGGESFYGHVHSNTKVWFDNNTGDGADFYDRMTTATNSYGGTTNNASFAYGLELNADQDTMANVDFNLLRTNALLGGYVVTGHTYIVFTGTTMKVTNPRKGWTNQSITVGTNNIIYVTSATSGSNREGRVYVRGVLDGRITVVNEEDVFINGHLEYANYPTNSGANDALGLVSKDDIWVNTNAPNNVRIQAAMMATGSLTNDSGSFGVVNHNVGSPRGNLNVWGSIVQEVRGAVGTFNSSGTATGFAKKYGFDTRFRANPPPYYPRLSTKLELSDWREGPG